MMYLSNYILLAPHKMHGTTWHLGQKNHNKQHKRKEITNERYIAEEDIQAHIDQIVNERQQSKNDGLNLKYTKEVRKELLTNVKYNKYMQQLNEEQKTIIMYHRKWCKDTVLALKTK